MNVDGRSLSSLTRRAARALLGCACLAAPAAAQATIAEFGVPAIPYSLHEARLAGMGDIDGDGRADFVLGMPYANGGLHGVVQLRSGADGSVLRQWTGAVDNALFGVSVDSAGDVDGDGLADVVVGEPGNFFPAPGWVHVYSSATGLPLHEIAGEAYDLLGLYVAGVGDIDGDGHADFAAGAPNEVYPTHISQPGHAKVFSGATGAVLALIVGDYDGQGLGRFVRPAGDVNADGVPDVAMLVGGYMTSFLLELRVYSGAWIAHGTGPAVLVDVPDVALFGSMDRAGDVDGDGFDDLLIGVPYDEVDPAYPGGFFVLSGQDHSKLLEFVGSAGGQGLGREVAAAGDLDHDGVPDLLASSGGVAVAVSGRDGTVIGSLVAACSGLAGVGDVNADGTPDWGISSTDTSSVKLSQVGLWTDLGHGLAGANGVPQLSGSGLLTGGSPASLQLHGALPSAPVSLVVGTLAVNLPFKGGVLVPGALFVFHELLSDALGDLAVGGTLPADAPSSELFFQVWQADAAGPHGYAASNAVRAQVP